MSNSNTDGPMNKLPLIPDSRAFSPSYYEQFDVEEDVDEDDDTPSEDEVDSGSSASSRRKMLENALLKSVKGNNQRNEAGDLPKMVFNVNIVQEAPSAFNTTDGKISRVDIQPASTESKGPQESSKISGLTKGTHYSTIIPANALQVLMTRIKEFILSRPDKPAIIQLQDLSDMMEGSNVTGRRIVLGLNAMVASLRKDHGVSCVLAMHSYPPLLDPENLDLTLNFYDDLFEGNIAVKDNYDSESDSSMWADGTFFKTTLDAAKSLPLEKIEIAPPAPTLVIKQDSFDGVRMQDDFNDYLHQLDKETLLSVRELNLKSLEMVCKDKGVSLSPLTTMALISRPTEADTQDVLKPIPEATFLLDDSVWTLEELDRLVSLAAAKAMEENSIKRNIEVKTEHLDQALELIRSTDHSRLVIGSTSVSPRSSLLDDSSMPLSPEIPNKASSGKTFEKKAPESKQPDPCSVTAFLKKNNVQLNAHEKKLIGTVIDPCKWYHLVSKALSLTFLYVQTAKIRTSFSDLVLPPSTKLILQTLVTLPFMRPAYFESGILSKHYINGVLLFGPPGTGKTLLAKAVAKSSGARFMNVSLSNIFDKFVGEGEKNVKAIFTLARKLSPCVVFLDEIDALFGARRNEGTQSSKREIVNGNTY